MSFLSSYPSKKIPKYLDGERVYLRSPEYRDWEKAFNANVHQSLDEVYDEYSMSVSYTHLTLPTKA